MYKFTILLTFLFIDVYCTSQTIESKSSAHSQSIDTSFICSYTDHLGIYTFGLRKYRTYGLKNKENDIKLKFDPNGQTNLGLGFNYKWINFGVSASFDFMNKDYDVYGRTDRIDIQVNAFSRHLGLSAHYQNYLGFHLSNPEDFIPSDSLYYPYLSDLESTSFGFSLFYFLNSKKFSYKAAYIRNEVQKKSAGGFILGAYFDIDELNRTNGFVPEELPDSLNQLFNFNGYATYVAGFSFGYAYTLVLLKRFFINLSLVPGIGYRALTVDYTHKSQSTIPNFTGSVSVRATLAYEGKHFYSGITSYSNAESFKYESFDISTSHGLLRFYVGKRFNIRKKK